MTMPAVLAPPRLTPRNTALIIVGLLLAQALLLHAMGHPLICPCGEFKLWYGVPHSPENSQQLTDWYSFTHVVHGISLYFLIWLVWRNAPVAARLLLAVFIEGAWEILENSEMIINRYRTQTMWREYYGDSIVNSLSDTGMMMLGFALAYRLPVLLIVALAVAMEAMLIVLIRDSLFLNIVMLIHPFEAIKAWQASPPI